MLFWYTSTCFWWTNNYFLYWKVDSLAFFMNKTMQIKNFKNMLNSIFRKEMSLDLSRVFLNDIEESHFFYIALFPPSFHQVFLYLSFPKSQGPKWRYMIVFLVKNQLDCADILSAVWLIKSYYHFSNFLLCTVGQNWKNSVINRAFFSGK